MQIDLNCDAGESFGAFHIGSDEELIPLVTSANVACGFHGGDPLTLDRVVALAQEHGVAVGAHPGLPDLAGFGRREMHLSPAEIENGVLYQIGAVAAFCRARGIPLVHVKAHGALYNMAAIDPMTARSIARGIARFDRDLVMVGLASSNAMADAAREEGLSYAREAFADRVYNPDGTLQSRKVAGSLIVDPTRAAKQAVDIARGLVVSSDGTRIELRADTICLHGDNPSAVANARAVRSALSDAGLDVRRLDRRALRQE
ncbi:MAG: LamB/YcsF family protein [Chloroflexi bacterium]|nr:LamB/YcsF family protein [Chloroflexota bacterium]